MVTGAAGVTLFAVVISTRTRAREFKFDDLDPTWAKLVRTGATLDVVEGVVEVVG